MHRIDVPVLIVGGGGCGLSSSIFLSDMGTDHVLIERHESTSVLPKAHYLNQRTMEAWRTHGIDKPIYEVGAPVENYGHIRWVTSLGGDGPFDRRDFHEFDAFGGGELRELYERDSASLPTNLPQLRLEPILRRIAEERGPGKILYGHELLSWAEDESGVTAQVRVADSGEEIEIRAGYVIAADGGKTIGPKLEIPMIGPTNMVDMVSTHFSADLSEYVDDRSMITWQINPEGEGSWGSGALVKMGPTWDRHSEEWVVHFAFRPDDPARFDEEQVVGRIRTLLKIPGLEMKVHKVSHWILDRIVADTWRSGRIFLAGDAAHRQPPTTGLGLNSAVHDAQNLCWKLAEVVSGRACDALLDTYEAERKPVAIDNADWALQAFMNFALIDVSMGLMPGAPPEANQAAFAAFFSDTRIGEAIRARFGEVINTQRVEFHAHDVEIGYAYETGALLSDGTPTPARDPFGHDYRPTTRPGHRLPHAWLDGSEGRISTHDLVRPGGFALLAGPGGADWVAAATKVAGERGVAIEAHCVDGTDLTDADGQWAQVNELEPGGALLVRPDQHVAFRSIGAADDAEAQLQQAFDAVLARPVAASV
ncbi:MAG: aromatic ring hydroxylase [Conexibacter sp.]|nr:aromatic ring hydroxylase [Conexibacter sp.]